MRRTRRRFREKTFPRAPASLKLVAGTRYTRQQVASREGNWWSRSWGAVALAAFAVHLGAAVYEAVVIAPLWSVDPPKTVTAWNALALKPDSSTLFEPLVAVLVVATSMAWMSGIGTRGWRRWWLTLSLLAAGGVAATTLLFVMPAERELFGAGALAGNAATIIAWTGDWMRAALMRMGALLVGMWSLYRAQLSGTSSSAERVAGEESLAQTPPGGASRLRRAREFSFGDEPDSEISLGDEAENPRQRWRRSLPGHRRTAKK
jgi:hypothetical protein